MTEAPLPNLLQMTALDPKFRADPHAVLDDLRARCPVRRDEMSGSFVLTRYDDVRGLISDRTLWRDPLRAEAGATLPRRGGAGGIEGAPRGESRSLPTRR